MAERKENTTERNILGEVAIMAISNINRDNESVAWFDKFEEVRVYEGFDLTNLSSQNRNSLLVIFNDRNATCVLCRGKISDTGYSLFFGIRQKVNGKFIYNLVPLSAKEIEDLEYSENYKVDEAAVLEYFRDYRNNGVRKTLQV